VECHRREDIGTEGADGVVCDWGGIWGGGCAAPTTVTLTRFFSNLGLKYTICGAFWALSPVQFINASHFPDDLDYLLIFY